MALSQANITGTTFVESSLTYNILKTMTVQSYTAGSTTIRVDVGSDSDADQNNPLAARDVGRYLFHRQQRHPVRITSVAVVSGQSSQFDIGLEKPFDVSDFRAYTDADGNAFSETAPAAGDNLGISLTMEDLFRAAQRVDIASDGTGTRTVEPESTSNDNGGGSKATFENITINTPDAYVVNDDIDLPDDCIVVMENGTLRGTNLFSDAFQQSASSDASAWWFGRVHPNWSSGESTPQDYYTSGGVILYHTGQDASGAPVGTSYQFVNCQLLTPASNGEAFLRFYASSETPETIQRNIFIDTKLENVGIRPAGNRSFFKNVQYNDGVWRGINFRAFGDNIFGYIENVSSFDSNGLLYYYFADSGDTTTVLAPQMINPDKDAGGNDKNGESQAGFVGLWQSTTTGGAANEQNKILNLDDLDLVALEDIEDNNTSSDWYFIRLLDDAPDNNGPGRRKTGSFVRIRGTLKVEALDSNGGDFDDTNSKGFVWTSASGDQDDITYDLTAVSDGQFAEEKIRIHSFQNGLRARYDDTPSATGTDNVRYVDSDNPAKVAIHARGYLPARTELDLREYGVKTYRPTILIDEEHSTGISLSTIDSYSQLETAQKLYDYAAKVIYNNPEAVAADGSLDFFTKVGDTITVTGADVEFATSDFTLSDANNIFDTKLYYEQSTDDTDAVHVRINSNTSFTGNIVVDSDKDVTVTHTIGGGIEADNIINPFTDGDTIINTDQKIVGTISLNAGGTYTVDGGADISEVTFTKNGSGNDPVVLLEDAVTDDGTNQTTFTDVTATIRCTVEVTGIGTYVSSDENTRAYSNDGTNYTSQTVSTPTAITDGYTFTVDYPNGDTLIVATAYEGYKVASATTTGTSIDFGDLEVYAGDEFAAHALSSGEQDFVDNSTITSDATNGLDIQVPVTAITIDKPASVEIFWEWMSSGNYLNAICQEHIVADEIDFDRNGIVVNNTGKLNIEKSSDSSNIVRMDIEATDKLSNNNVPGNITDSSSLREVRLLTPTTKVLVPQTVADSFADTVSDNLDDRKLTQEDVENISLNIPV